MFVLPHHSIHMASGPEVRPSLPIPTVYEQLPSKPAHWEYQVLSLETAETPFLDAERLNALGKESWMLVGLLDERATGRGTKVYYYFMRLLAEDESHA